MVVFLTFSGNFMYFMGYSKWLLVASRLVTGLTHAHKHAAADQDFARCNLAGIRLTSQVSVQEQDPPSSLS